MIQINFDIIDRNEHFSNLIIPVTFKTLTVTNLRKNPRSL